MSEAYTLTVRPGHPDFLDLPWEKPIAEWECSRFVVLPRGLSRHEVRFVSYQQGVYVIKEMPSLAARREYDILRALEDKDVSSAVPVAIISGRYPDPGAERSAAIITRYLDFSFSYLELLQGPGFGARRDQMLDAFAGLLVELHLIGCFWGDCSLANVLYRHDADAIETIMIDGETAAIHPSSLSDGQRREDLEIMIINVAGGMADIAASQNMPIEAADLTLGEAIAERYRALWAELDDAQLIGPDERYKITEKLQRLNDLGFDVDEVNLVSTPGGDRLRMKITVGERNFHSARLRGLTGIDALDRQARQILSDLHYYQARNGAFTPTDKAVSAMRWRVGVFEPLLERLRALPGVNDPLQSYCELLHHRYVKSVECGHDIGTEAALTSWLAANMPDPSPGAAAAD
jgi:hypothetical protein